MILYGIDILLHLMEPANNLRDIEIGVEQQHTWSLICFLVPLDCTTIAELATKAMSHEDADLGISRETMANQFNIAIHYF